MPEARTCMASRAEMEHATAGSPTLRQHRRIPAPDTAARCRNESRTYMPDKQAVGAVHVTVCTCCRLFHAGHERN